MAARGCASSEAMTEIERARRDLAGKPKPQCCCESAPTALAAKSPSVANVGDLLLEDQSGATFKYSDFFRGRPSVVTFFYTRCMNPKKCSLTISKLAALQRRLAGMDIGTRINIAAFTYDPVYDRARRLQMYGM
jgi:protein SCO1/2